MVFTYRKGMGDLTFFRLIRRAPIIAVPKYPFSSPRSDVTELFRKCLWIRRSPKCFYRQNRRGGMVTMGCSWDSVEAVDNDIGLKISDDPHHIGEHLLFVPVV